MAQIMKSTSINYPAAFSLLTEDEMSSTQGGTAFGEVWEVIAGSFNIITATVTGLASAIADVAGSVIAGEMDPLMALCSSFFYLAGNVVASIIWRLAMI